MNHPKYLRFVRALALAAVVPGCGVEDTTTSAPLAASGAVTTPAPTARPAPDATPAPTGTNAAPSLRSEIDEVAVTRLAEQLADGGGGAGGGAFSSGPIVPPELPRGFA